MRYLRHLRISWECHCHTLHSGTPEKFLVHYYCALDTLGVSEVKDVTWAWQERGQTHSTVMQSSFLATNVGTAKIPAQDK